METLDLDKAIAKIESQETDLISIENLPPISDADIEKMILNN